MKKLLIFPYNGNAREAVDCLSDDFELIGFIDDAKEKQGRQENNFTVYSREVINRYPEAKILAVPGSPSSYLERKKIIESLGLTPARFTALIHRRAAISPLARIGSNVLIGAGVVVTGNAKIGSHICILPNTVIHHDTVIGDFSLVGSNVTIAGGTKIGVNCYIGSGSSIINGISIGDRTLVGLGSNVIRPVFSDCKVAGNPARKIGAVT